MRAPLRRRAHGLAGALVIPAWIAGGCNLVAGIPDKPGTGGAGAPLTCNVDADCDDHEPCTEDACGADKVCRHQALADGPAPSAYQKAGDCRTLVCHGGASSSDRDDGDTPDDGKDCTLDLCADGVPANVPKGAGATCVQGGSTGLCDAQGECLISCVSADECLAPSPCIVPACNTTTGLCEYSPLQDGTPTPGVAPVAGDCHISLCFDGEVTFVVDDSDVPVTANDCDVEVCTGGTPSNPPKPGNGPCSTYMGELPGRCDDLGICRECVADADCNGPTDDCRRPACVNYACTEVYRPPLTPTLGNPPQIEGDCRRVVCDGNGGTMIVDDISDPEDDNNACTADACAAGAMTQHTNVANGTTCGAGNTLACVGGDCIGCTVASQCDPASCSANVFTYAQSCDGMGSCVAPIPPIQACAPYLCTLSGCTTSCTGDAGCSQAGNGNYCTAAGVCTAKLIQGTACTAPNQCQSGFCVDGRCCNTACTGACQACSAAKKGAGANGSCGAITSGTDPDGECADGGAASCGLDGFCDGAGACRKYASGTVCKGASCATSALTMASTCNGTGTCTAPAPVACPGNLKCASATTCAAGCGASSSAGDMLCVAGYYCDGVNAGACKVKKASGSTCARAGECVSGICGPLASCQ